MPKDNASKFKDQYNPYFIESLRKRTFKGSAITIEKEVVRVNHHTIYLASYRSDNLKIYALLSIPAKDKPKAGFPVLILDHGYIDPKSYSTENSYRTTFNTYASQENFIVIKPDYRANGQSEGDRNNKLNRISYAIDVLNLIASVKYFENADPEKIVLWGHSLGGDVTLRVLEVSDKIKAASLWAPVSAPFPENILYFVRKRRPQEILGYERVISHLFDSQFFSKISPIDNLGLIKAPIVIHHGTSDESVPYEWSTILDNKLSDKNITHTFYTYKGEDHNFNQGKRSLIIKRDLEFFKNTIK